MDEFDEWTTKCIICQKDLNKGITVNITRLGSYIATSKILKDNKHFIFENRESILIHSNCSKTYNSKKSLASKKHVETAQASTSGRTTTSQFDYENKCIFCQGEASDNFIAKQLKRSPRYRVVVRKFHDAKIRDSLILSLQNSTNIEHLKVVYRLSTVDDLIAVRARYHDECYRKYRRPVYDGVASEPHITKVLSYITSYISAHGDECQFSVNDILDNHDCSVMPEKRYLTSKLREIFGPDIFVHTCTDGLIISFLNTGLKKILNDKWYRDKQEDEESERKQIVQVAAKIILEDIREKICDMHNYASIDSYASKIQEDIPESLLLLLNTIILSNKKSVEKSEKKIVAIAHAIMCATRPRSYLSPLLIGLGVTLSKKFASRELLQILSALGFCATYEECTLLQASILKDNQDFLYGNSTVQTVGDNADHDTETLSGHGTVHIMGRMEIITPKPDVPAGASIPRLRILPSAKEIGQFGKVNLQYMPKFDYVAMEKITVQSLEVQSTCEKNNIKRTDLLWLYGKFKNPLDFIGWNGFMQKISEDLRYEISRTRILPFIDNPASSYDTIYTLLLKADAKCKFLKQKHMFITFDQPLYMKAREILILCKDNLSSIIIKLGGFHTLMSFMGSIGFIMSGSGIKEVFAEIYAEKSIEKLLNGHAYSRAVRAHTLTHTALASIIFSEMELSENEEQDLNEKLQDIDSTTIIKIEDPLFTEFFFKFNEKLRSLEQKGPVAQLWLQYFHLITLLKNFIMAERSANWKLHLETAKNIIPYFHAAGHHLYAKSCHLYVQDMQDLENIMDIQEYHNYTTEGRFAVRLTNKFWAGIWSDMAIEMCLMKVMKTRGGLTHGRGVTESVVSKWVLTMPAVIDISDFIMKYSNVSCASSEQHVDARESRIKRDSVDLSKLLKFFEDHEPFMECDTIMNIASGMKGSSEINCHKAYDVGIELMRNIVGLSFDKVKYKKKNRVFPLQALTSIKINNEAIIVDPTLIFQRMCLTVGNDREKLKDYFRFELAPFPVTLFDNGYMRKTEKSKLYDYFLPLDDDFHIENYINVIDGGFLLHKVVWPKQDTFGNILKKYIDYVSKNYKPNSYVVFDGYPDGANIFTKTAERFRRQTREMSREIIFNVNTEVTVAQEKFLTNDKNKKRLIAHLQQHLHAAGFRTKVATEDADTLIVSTAIDESAYENVVIVGEDIDLLVILSQLAPDKSNIYFCKPSKRAKKSVTFTSNSCQYEHLSKNLAFIHAFSGCDTTSAFYNQGKGKLLKILDSEKHLADELLIFNEENVEKEKIIDLGNKIVKLLYGAANKYANMTLNEYRYNCYKKKCRMMSNFKLYNLPPTESAAAQHSLRVYHQIQRWHGHELNAVDWGWKTSRNGLQPIFCDSLLIPDDILKVLNCGCKSDCKKSCGCVKKGMRCSEFCLNCSGLNCSNKEDIEILLADESESVNEDIQEGEEAYEDTEMPIEFLYPACENDIENTNDSMYVSDVEFDDVLSHPNKKQKLY